MRYFLRAAAVFLFSASAIAQDVNTGFDQYPEHDHPSDIPARTFAADSSIEAIRLSPNGKYFIRVTPAGNVYRIEVLPFDPSDERSYLSTNVRKGKYQNVFWANDDRVMIQTQKYGFDRKANVNVYKMLYGVQFDSSDPEPLFIATYRLDKTYTPDLVLHVNPTNRDTVIITYTESGKGWSGIHELDVYTGTTEEVSAGVKYIDDWHSDANGEVRFGMGWYKKKLYLVARTSVEDKWRYLDAEALGDPERFDFLAYDKQDPTIIYVKATRDLGRDAIYRFNLESGEFAETFYKHDTLDAGWLKLDAQEELLAAVSQGDRLERHYFRSEYEKLVRTIDTALPDRDNFVIQITENGKYALVFSSSDRYPGAYYRYDIEGKSLDGFGEINPSLNPSYVQPVKPYEYTARDGLKITGYLTMPANDKEGAEIKPPLVVMPHGGPWARDTQAYSYWSQYLVAQGFAVLQPNFRGSSGFGREFELAGNGEWGGAMIDDLADGAQSLVDAGLVDGDRMCVVGASFGGYAALMSGIRYSDRFDCAVAVAPISDLKQWANRLKKQAGKDYYGRIVGARGSKVFQTQSPVKLAKKMQVPVLLMHGMEDTQVVPEHSVKMNKALKKAKKSVKFVEVKGEGHTFHSPRNRTRLLSETVKFLNKHMK